VILHFHTIALREWSSKGFGVFVGCKDGVVGADFAKDVIDVDTLCLCIGVSVEGFGFRAESHAFVVDVVALPVIRALEALLLLDIPLLLPLTPVNAYIVHVCLVVF